MFVNRTNWCATEISQRPASNICSPVSYVVLAFMSDRRGRGLQNTLPFGSPTIKCVRAMQKQQKNDIRRAKDIRFSFVLGADGNVYMGRGWAVAPYLPHRLHKPLSRHCIYIGIMGNYLEPLPDPVLENKAAIIKYGIKNDYIFQNFYEVYLKHARLFSSLPNIIAKP